MAAPTWIAAPDAAAGTTTSVTIDKPSEVQAGDLMLAQIRSSGSGGYPNTLPAGWVVVASAAVTDHIRCVICAKIATGSEPSSYTWSASSASLVAMRGVITVVRGADPSNPINTFATVAGSLGANSPAVSPVATTTVDNCLLVLFVSTNAYVTFTPSSPAVTRYDNDTTHPLMKSSSIEQTSAGASSDTWQISATSIVAAVRVGIQPAVKLSAIAHHYRQMRA